MDLHFTPNFLDQGPLSTLEDFAKIYPEQVEFFWRCLKYLKHTKTTPLTLEERENLETEYLTFKLVDIFLTMEFPSITVVKIVVDL